MGKYTVGLPKGVYTGAEWARRVRHVFTTFNAQMANNYARGIYAFATSPALEIAARKWEAWIGHFFGAGVPLAYRQAVQPALQRYYAERRAIVAGIAAPIAPAPAPGGPAPAPAPAIVPR